MDCLARYIELIIEPTFEEFRRNPGSVRHAYLPCLVTYHAIDRAAYPAKSDKLLDEWRKKSKDFMLVEVVALHLKHVKSRDARRPLPPDALRITHLLGLEGNGEGLETRNLFFVVRDVIKFLHDQVKRSESPAEKFPLTKQVKVRV
jgi:hypothetical protein